MAGKMQTATAGWFGRFGAVRPRNVVALVTALSLVAVVLGTESSGAAGPDFTITAGPVSQSLAPGQSTKFYVEVTSVEGFNTPVKLSVTGLPEGVTAGFAPVNVTPTGGSFVTITAAATAGLGKFDIAIVGTAGSLVHSTAASIDVDFALVPKCTVTATGVVTDDSPAKNPIAGANVVGGGKSFTTDATGVYTLTGLELGANNAPIDLTITASKDAPAANHIGSFWTQTATGVLVCGRTLTKNITLIKSVGALLSTSVVEGQASNGDYNNIVPKSPVVPIQGAAVGIAGVASLVTDATGAAVFKDNTGLTGVHVATDNAPLTGAMTVAGPTSLPLRQRYWAAKPNVAFGPLAAGGSLAVPPIGLVRQCTTALNGVVTDSATGAVIAGANIAVKSADTSVSDPLAVVSAADGKFAIPAILFGYNNKPSALNLTVTATNYKSQTLASSLASCDGMLTVNPIMEKAVAAPEWLYGSVTGKVVDKDTNIPLANIKVTLDSCAPKVAGDCTSTASDLTGTWVISKVPIGTTADAKLDGELKATPPNAVYYPATADVTLPVSASPTVVPDIPLVKKRFGSASGKVVDSETKAPLVGVTMASALTLTTPCSAPCLTGPGGAYSFSGAPLGNNNTQVTSSISATFNGYWKKTLPVIYEADVNKVVDFELVKVCPTSTISGTVVNAATQAPIANAAVSAPNPSGSPTTVSTTTNAQGQYTLPGLIAGTDNTIRSVAVTAVATGYYNGSLTTPIGCGSQLELNFGIRPTITRLTPTSGSGAGGTSVKITGTDLTGLIAVTFGGVAATSITPVSSTEATAISPPHAAGVVDVQVVTSSGGASSATASTKFTYTAPPTTSTTTTSSTTTSSTTSTTVKPTTTTTTAPPTSTTTSTTSTTIKPTTTTTSTTTSTTIKPTTTTTTSTTVPVTTTTKPPTTTTTTIPSPTTTVPPVEPATVVIVAVLWLILFLLFGG